MGVITKFPDLMISHRAGCYVELRGMANNSAWMKYKPHPWWGKSPVPSFLYTSRVHSLVNNPFPNMDYDKVHHMRFHRGEEAMNTYTYRERMHSYYWKLKTRRVRILKQRLVGMRSD